MSYRPEDHNERNRHDLSPPPPPPEMPPIPPGKLPGHLLKGDSWRPQNDFSFRNSDAAPQYPRGPDSYRSGQGDNYRTRRKHQTNPDRNRWRYAHGVRVATAERPLLSVKQDGFERMLGMTDDANATKHFLSANDMSDSEEEQMKESESEKDEAGGVSLIKLSLDTMLDGTTADIVEPPAKRRAFGLTESGLEGEGNIPKWSNPDPYTVLPPINDTRKRKDVVKLIRKARIVTEKELVEQSQVAANDDFISFGSGDELPAVDDEASVPLRSYTGMDGLGVPGAPSRPKNFFIVQSARAPGTQSLPVSANTMGPPPGLARANAGMVIVNNNPAQDPALGNRKRTHDDTIKSALHPRVKHKGELAAIPKRSLTKDWLPLRKTDLTPWVDPESNYLCENAGFKLHKEICDFYEFVRPRKYEQSVREDLLQRLKTIVRSQLNCELHCFGSFAAGLYLPNADMDLVVISDEFNRSGRRVVCQNAKSMYEFASCLRRASIPKDMKVLVITHAKVPLVKFVDHVTSIKVDISFENNTGLVANETFRAWKDQFPAMPILVTVIKQFLMMRGLNEVVDGGLGGFSVTCLVTSLLQNMPRVQTGELIPEHHLGEMLIEFLDFYGNQLDISRTGIKMNPPGYFTKEYPARNSSTKAVYQADKANRLAIEDPNTPDNDISGGSRNVRRIFNCFSEAHEDILRAMKSPTDRSLLLRPLGGNYRTFVLHRDHLRKLFQQQWGAPEPGTVDLHDYIQPEISTNFGSHPNSDEDLPRYGLNQNEYLKKPPSKYIGEMKDHRVKVRKARKKPKKQVAKQKLNSLAQVSKQNQSSSQVGLNKKTPKPSNRAINQAKSSKHEYPGILGIPNSMTRQEHEVLITLHQLEEEKNRQMHQQVGRSDRYLLPSRPKTQGWPAVSETRRMEVARALAGLSNDNPISID